ncbi:MAG: hypothetical protein QNJ05_15275 [Woeseiaceae bacterium]|nr:hypothetical protein [Woeseiaceae bacterium]
MALIDCYECHQQVSTKAFACPHCGAPAENVLSGEALPAFAPPPPQDYAPAGPAVEWPGHKVHAATFAARSYFTIGGLIAAPITPFHGMDALMVYLAQYLLLGLGVALLAYAYTAKPRDKSVETVMVVGWVYVLIVGSAIVTANIVRFL